MDRIYVDQGGRDVNIPGFQFLSFYTPDGIKKIDSQFCHRIMAFKRGESYTEYSWSYEDFWKTGSPCKKVEMKWTDTLESLTNDIKNNVHLHPKIKKNLMYNLLRKL